MTGLGVRLGAHLGLALPAQQVLLEQALRLRDQNLDLLVARAQRRGRLQCGERLGLPPQKTGVLKNTRSWWQWESQWGATVCVCADGLNTQKMSLAYGRET